MDEILRLLKENNLMLRAICSYLGHSKEDSIEDIKDFVTNVVANVYANNRLDAK